MIQIPDYFVCKKCGIYIKYEEAGQMECGQCVFDDWIGVNKIDERYETKNKEG